MLCWDLRCEPLNLVKNFTKLGASVRKKLGCLPCQFPRKLYVVYCKIHVVAIAKVYLHQTTRKIWLWTVSCRVLFGVLITLPAGFFGICVDLIGGFEWRVTHDTALICFRFSFKLGISSYKMIYFLSNIYKWTPTLLTTGSSFGGIWHISYAVSQFVIPWFNMAENREKCLLLQNKEWKLGIFFGTPGRIRVQYNTWCCLFCIFKPFNLQT